MMKTIRSRPRGSALSFVVATLSLTTLFGALRPPAASAQRLLDPDAAYGSDLDITPIENGGFLAVWNRDRLQQLPFGPDFCPHDEIVGVELDALGEPVGAPTVIVPTMDQGGPPKVASRPLGGGSQTAVLAWRSAGEGLRLANLDFENGFDLPFSYIVDDCVADPGESIRGYDVVRAGARYWLVWSSTCDGLKIQAQRLEPSAQRSGPVVLVSDQAIGAQPGAAVGVVGQFDGGFSVAWVGAIPGGGRGVVARRFGVDGAPLTDTVQVSPGPATPGFSLTAGNGPVFGRTTVAWRAGDRLFVRELFDDLDPVGPAREVATVSELADAHPELAARGGSIVLAWRQSEVGSDTVSCPVARFFGSERTDAALPAGCLQPEVLASDPFHELVAGWLVEGVATGPLCTRPAAGLLATADDFPPGPSITDPEYPDFRFHVRIGGDEPNPRTGRAEPLCLPETVCVSGALAGRTEVLLRIVGPKPNGRLWPTLVRFTTSQVEVWIEQLSTGEVEYYLLRGSSPGSEELDGLFDREGFPPS